VPLLNGPHDNEATAALSITRNRVSKIDKLLANEEAATARRFAADLLADVCEWALMGQGNFEKARVAPQVAKMTYEAYRRARDFRTTEELLAERERLATSYPAGHNRARRYDERIAAIDAELIEREQK
jgi:hypothetical protein